MMDAAAYRAHIEPLIAEHFPEVFIVEFVLTKNGILRLLVDTDTGIMVDTCSKINRAIRSYFFEKEINIDNLAIEISSPGVGAPLRLPRQYRSNVGRQLKVNLLDGQTISGTLLDANDEGIKIDSKKAKGKAKAPQAAELVLSANASVNTSITATLPTPINDPTPLPDADTTATPKGKASAQLLETFVPFAHIRESRVVLPF